MLSKEQSGHRMSGEQAPIAGLLQIHLHIPTPLFRGVTFNMYLVDRGTFTPVCNDQ